MTKKIIYLLPTIMILENSGFAADAGIAALSTANQNYMALMLGSEGINNARGTDFQLRQMVDGAITAGITDRLYGFPDRSSELQTRVGTLPENKKLHAQLAYAFYALGRFEPKNMTDLKAIVINLFGETKANFNAELAKLCALAYSNGDIFAYKNSLEDVIKRASVPLNYVVSAVAGGAVGGVPPKPVSVAVDGGTAPGKPERYYTEGELASLDQPALSMYRGEQAKHKTPAEIRAYIKRMLTTVLEAKYVQAAVTAPPPVVVEKPEAVQEERYYTDAELQVELAADRLEMGPMQQYKKMRTDGRPPRLARMAPGLGPKYKGE